MEITLDNLNIKLTDRMTRILGNAEKEAELSGSKILKPPHLLIGCLQEKTGVLGEISLKSTLEISSIRAIAKDMDDFHNKQQNKSNFFNITVTDEVTKVMDVAIEYMKGYNQVYLNEGHLLKALIVTDVINSYLTDYNKNIILTLGTTARDMISYLGDYTFPDKGIIPHIIQIVSNDDFERLVNFVKHNFSDEWSKTVEDAFLLDNPPLYMALNNEEEIVGFAAFDVYKNKKCYFGPMGVSTGDRVNGIGYSLLHHCLKDMKIIGYEYTIIGGAGPIEFYEKACNAVVIPSTT